MFSIGDSVEIISPKSPLRGLNGTIVGGPNINDIYEVQLDPTQQLPAGWYGGYQVSVAESDLAYYLFLQVGGLPMPDFLDGLDELFKEPEGPCECGGDKCGGGHSHWCPKYKPYK
jgi:hypothetical protein